MSHWYVSRGWKTTLQPSGKLNGKEVDEINTDLTTGIDLTKAQRLVQNTGVAFMGDTKGGPFDISGDLAREWLLEPENPNGRPNSDVLKPWMNGMAITRRPADKWIIDFGFTMEEEEAGSIRNSLSVRSKTRSTNMGNTTCKR